MFLRLRSVKHEYTIMKWLAGLPPLFASSSPLTSPHLTLSPVSASSLFHSRLLFCFFTRSWYFAFSLAAAFLLFHPRHSCFFAFLLWSSPELPPSVLLCFNHKVGPTEQNRSSISGGWTFTLYQFNMTRTILMFGWLRWRFKCCLRIAKEFMANILPERKTTCTQAVVIFVNIYGHLSKTSVTDIWPEKKPLW